MLKNKIVAAVVVGGVALLLPAVGAQAATAPLPYKFANCTALQKSYPHGVGKSNAVDKTTGVKVTTFRHDTNLYNAIVKYRADLDRDKDGIACEKR